MALAVALEEGLGVTEALGDGMGVAVAFGDGLTVAMARTVGKEGCWLVGLGAASASVGTLADGAQAAASGVRSTSRIVPQKGPTFMRSPAAPEFWWS
jgi:hypothetical protein